MSFIDLNIKYSYDSSNDNILNDFYIPVLFSSIKYDRIAGYFSSSSLAISARGIAGLIKNNGKMRLIVSPYLSESDINIINQSIENPYLFLEKKLVDDIKLLEDEFQNDHLKALGWMLANELLSIKVAFINNKIKNNIDESALFHQKIGILEDNEKNQISFSGSINETASGWLYNIEEFKVFKSWEDGQKNYLNEDKIKFNDFWNNKRENISVIDLPEAVKRKLINMVKNFDKDEFIAKTYEKIKVVDKNVNNIKIIKSKQRINLFPYQQNAVEMCKSNNFNILFEMATGTGKTITTIFCIEELIKINTKIIVIISCPQNTLSKQWLEQIKLYGPKFDESIIADSSNRNWHSIISDNINKLRIDYYNKIVIYTTHKTASSENFIKIFSSSNLNIPICFIGDEVHNLGASIYRKALLEIYKYRIGLSATPRRWFDDEGTEFILNYFGDKIFEFTINDALSTINPITNDFFLVKYYYHPIFIDLLEEELYSYIDLSYRILKFLKKSNKSELNEKEEKQKKLEKLYFERAKILVNAKNKFSSLEDIIAKNNIKNTIIFVSDKQIDEVSNILAKHKIRYHKFTQNQGTKPEKKYGRKSEREYLIEKFKSGDYQALVAIKCLDEGIDIPSASSAILMANSSNPREYIQRIGRVIRQDKEKTKADIFDLIVKPDISRINDSNIKSFEMKIFEKEMVRVKDMASNASNNSDVITKINEIERSFNYGY